MDTLSNLFLQKGFCSNTSYPEFDKVLRSVRLYMRNIYGEYLPVTYCGLVNHYSNCGDFCRYFLFKFNGFSHVVDRLSISLGTFSPAITRFNLYYVSKRK